MNSHPPIAHDDPGCPDRASVPDDVPSGALPTAGFYGRLLVAWIAMGSKVPEVAVKGAIDA